MTKILIAAAIGIALLFGIKSLLTDPDYVTEARFEEAHKEIVSRLDTLEVKVDSIAFNLLQVKLTAAQIKEQNDKLTADVDTLKAVSKQILKNTAPTKTFTQSFNEAMFNFFKD
jgi:formate dehydrogenase maturation protein FdhE